MTLAECLERVDGSWIIPGKETEEFFDVVVSDLMSDVLVTELEDFLLVTSLTSEQVLRTADIVDARAILITNGKQPQERMRSLAQHQTMPIMVTPLTTFDTCRALADCKKQ
ncbi:hypothetical protein AU468_02380 [Alkalispirochaeta sphaeroplastigenens]|uniref:DRTGG domain-containing protein n=2 Tax=Alkalispirochaeta TaxID=2024958 RepID=A0A2S4JZ15_9SPIO|nr:MULTISPECIES: DRTGG domain-containing protein [Alkalispirochaeta]POR04765.1 hypothetical protein AU468_02380 [Alkalispirochaeta sphaeroplastigenens]